MLRDHADGQRRGARPEDSAGVPGAVLPSALTSYIVFLLRRVFLRFGADAQDDTDFRDLVVLEALTERDWLSQLDLAEWLDINRTIMVSVIDRLERDGSVARSRNRDDRRSYVITLTDQGRMALDQMRQVLADRDRRLTASLAEPEVARLNELLARLLPDRPRRIPNSSTYLVAQAHDRLRKLGDEKLTETGLRMRHLAPLSTLRVMGSCAQRELADRLGITEPAIAPLVDDLARAGLVQRGRDRHDRRRYALELTELGRERLTEVQKAAEELQSHVADLLDDDGKGEHALRVLLLKLLGQDTSPPA